MNEIRKQQQPNGTRVTREFRRAEGLRSQDRYHPSTTECHLPPIQAPLLPLWGQEWEGAGIQQTGIDGSHSSEIKCILGTKEESNDAETWIVKRTWPWSRGRNVEPDLPLTVGLSEGHFSPPGLHCLNWKFRGSTALLSAVNSNKLHFYKEMKLSVISPAQLDQSSSSSPVARNIKIEWRGHSG